MAEKTSDVEELAATLAAAERGEPGKAAELFPLLYQELHRLARRQLRLNAGGLTLGATTLLHEAYLNLTSRARSFPDRARFFAYAARAMRALIIDYARERRALKRGGGFHLTSLDAHTLEEVAQVDDLAPLADVLEELADAEPELAELVDLKFFCGFSFGEIAAMRSVSERTVQRDWSKARVFLRGALSDD